ncbi:uncharacterized protein BDZ83DRAFT_212137 [Colletotrichum acutatum]|uniref:Secreted protein n=1 Tax=Glomerella acutata TaxID=27357 RepID=A0AAD8UW20_GLOAC|nr:uncharacterized protein BDZ83DRAFT_212137 [Colletotrichum acutatum]KAK1727330.1 hypothetical protein BDZ83DRAFT_212137 [Colletotrichum acutatum]
MMMRSSRSVASAGLLLIYLPCTMRLIDVEFENRNLELRVCSIRCRLEQSNLLVNIALESARRCYLCFCKDHGSSSRMPGQRFRSGVGLEGTVTFLFLNGNAFSYLLLLDILDMPGIYKDRKH